MVELDDKIGAWFLSKVDSIPGVQYFAVLSPYMKVKKIKQWVPSVFITKSRKLQDMANEVLGINEKSLDKVEEFEYNANVPTRVMTDGDGSVEVYYPYNLVQEKENRKGSK
jgi:hypothetical protein